jgi:hypothetical protein
MNRSRRIDWRLCRLQAVLYGVAALTFSTSDFVRIGGQAVLSFRPALLLTVTYVAWVAAGLVLAAGAQWAHAASGRGLWRGVLVVVVAAAMQGPLFVLLMYAVVNPVLSEPFAVLGSSVYVFWLGTLSGGLFFGYCLLVQRSRDRRGLLARAEIERTNTEARLRETQTWALEQRFDPALLERSLGGLRSTYAHDRAAGEDLLGALVEALRLAVPAACGGAPPDHDAARRAWNHLRERLEILEPHEGEP